VVNPWNQMDISAPRRMVISINTEDQLLQLLN
jgi:hypothetical protein